MKDTKDLLKEAIADAKAVRATALQQAKLALEEAFTPRLQSMFTAKLQEAYDDEELEEAKEADNAKTMDENTDEFTDNNTYTDEIDLDEILAELENEINEAKDDDKAAKAEEEVEDEAEETVDDETMDAVEDEEEDKEVKDLSMDELEDMIKDIIAQETGAGDDGKMGDDMTADVGDGIDLGADIETDMSGEENLEEELDAILAELLAEDDNTEIDEAKKVEESKKIEEDLKLALETVETLRSELNEINLLNAKLLYVNKIFKAKNLNESQKLKVVKAFDKVGTPKEAKLIYESLSDAFSNKGKAPLKESLGFASKSAGVATKQVIVEGNDFIARMQKLANIK